MQYKAVGFDPSLGRGGGADAVAASLEKLIASYAASGWEFVGVQNHSTIIPGSSGCFGIGATSPYPHTFSVVVFRSP
jgi:hypothetical protein